MNYVALLWVEVGQPGPKAPFQYISKETEEIHNRISDDSISYAAIKHHRTLKNVRKHWSE
jgi:hypothetical protein